MITPSRRSWVLNRLGHDPRPPAPRRTTYTLLELQLLPNQINLSDFFIGLLILFYHTRCYLYRPPTSLPGLCLQSTSPVSLEVSPTL